MKHSNTCSCFSPGVDVDVVEDLRVHTDNKLDWVKNTTALYRKGSELLHESVAGTCREV